MTLADPFESLRVPQLERPFDLASLLAASRERSWWTLTMRVGANGSTVAHARDHGLTWQQADTWAIRCGMHPAEVWPSWYADVEPEEDADAVPPL